ncbi:CAP Gly-rich domain-containing protein [Chlamydoabsidia padenii]|nr:CAP Gly-rich domain-containing protein [Chlamydoabsidia padenii]
MPLFGFTKKTKKRLSSGQLRLGLRKVKSTGNIAADDSDSSTDSDELENYPPKQSQKATQGSANSTPDDTPRSNSPGGQCNQGVNPDDLDFLLSMETQQRLDAQTERDKLTLPPRPTRLKFELPVTPSRSRSPSNQPIAYPRARPYRSLSEEKTRSHRKPEDAKSGPRKPRHRRWSKLMGSDDDSDSEKRQVEVGTYVRLLKRPLPTMGYVRYIGPVEGEPGDWIGVELQHRVGNCDGLIRGQRFFKTDPQRGIFLKRFDVEAVI